MNPRALAHVALEMLLSLAAVTVSAQPSPSIKPGRPVGPVVTVAPVSGAASATAGYLVEPAPAWVLPAPDDAGVALPPAPMSHRYIDEQTRIGGRSDEHYVHVLRVAGDASGLATAAQLEIEFDPSFQTLVLHQIDVLRAGAKTTRIDRKKIQLLQREANLERRMYDGRVTLSLAMDDVRVGDAVEFAYTLRGVNPVWSGRYVASEWMVSGKGPVGVYRQRVLAPATRSIAVKPGSAGMTVATRAVGEMKETTVVRRAVAVVRPEPNASVQVVLDQMVAFSEFTGWDDVAGWGRMLFAEPAGATPLLDRKAAEIAAASADPAARTLAALDFVQKEIRYFGTEIGLNTHTPASPERVLQQRFGDCKDKVSLLLALLRRMNIAGEPVLVSTRYQAKVAQMLPTPLAFDHVIARVPLGEQVYWLDATRGQQTGPLGARQALSFGRGLALGAAASGRPAEAAMVALPSVLGQLRLRVEDRYTVDDFAQGATLESRITLRGDLAEGVRMGIAANGIESTRAQFSGVYLRLYPNARTLQPVSVEPVEGDDAVLLVQRFALPEFWGFPEQRALVAQMAAWSVADAVRIPLSETRRDPLRFPYPGTYTHRITLKYPVDVADKANTIEFDDDGKYFALHMKAELAKNGLQVDADLAFKVDELPAAEWQAYGEQMRKDLPRLGYNAVVSPIPMERLPAAAAELKALGESMRNGASRPKTQVQAEAPVRVLVLSQQIDGGRLAPRFLAQALVERAIQRDRLGQYERAAQDLARAVAAQPAMREAANATATNALLRGDTARALQSTDAVLAQSPRDGDALWTRALARHLAQDDAGARTDLVAMFEGPAAWRRGYPLVLWSVVQRRLGSNAAPPGRTEHTADLPADWPRPLVEWAEGRADADAVLRAAAANPPQAAERLTEANYWLGERALGDGDLARAQALFRKSVEQGIVEFTEHALARRRLAETGSR